MSKRILVVLGHPNPDSYCGALAGAYARGAAQAGAEVRSISLGELDFDPILHRGYREVQPLEPCLESAQRDITWAEHIVFVYPTWWGTMPALLKGFFDRVFLPGFAFKYRPDSSLWDKLLKGRSARLIVTMDSPRWWDYLVYRNAGINAVRQATLKYCGLGPVRVTTIARLRWLSDEQRSAWLEKAEMLGREVK